MFERRRPAIAVAVLLALLALPAAASARLPKPSKTAIVPGTSIAGVKLDMTKAQVLHQWGTTACPNGICQWKASSKPGAESATVSIYRGKAIMIVIHAASNPQSGKFIPGVLSRWKTARNIGLGSQKSAVHRAYPSAKANSGEAVQGYDLFAGARPNLRYTRFSTPGFGASASRLRYIEFSWDTCHIMSCR